MPYYSIKNIHVGKVGGRGISFHHKKNKHFGQSFYLNNDITVIYRTDFNACFPFMVENRHFLMYGKV